MIPTQLLSGSGSNVWTLTISADADNVNIKDELEALYGTITTKKDVVVVIASGVKVGCNNWVFGEPLPALKTGSYPSGSTLKIINLGYLYGGGGIGGDAEGGGGNIGGDAIDLGIPVTIDNTSGYIFGGGGGAGAGNKAPGGGNQGGGGGGGRGRNGGAGGAGGNNGQAGSESAPGEGGAGIGSASGGGRGGDWGAYGNDGGDYGSALGGPGAAPGYAVRKNGKSVTWLGGNNSTQVKGSVA